MSQSTKNLRCLVMRLIFLIPVILLTACTAGDSPMRSTDGAQASFESYAYNNDFGTRSYKVFVPASYDGGPVPLIVELHGCGGDGEEEARWSRFNELAEAQTFIVAYPDQDPEANGSRCWNWFLPEHQERGAGEPSLIAGITDTVIASWNIDTQRVYIGGISAGGAMADVMAATYPDRYAAALVYAGCEYKGTTCTGGVAAVPPETAGQWAYEASAGLGRVVPVIVIQGDQDAQVPFPNAELVVQQFLTMDDWADDGADNGSVAREPTSTTQDAKPDGHNWEIDIYTDATGCVLAERWLIHGMGHAWSSGGSDGSTRDELFTDALGPQVHSRVIDFFMEHPMPLAGTGCQAG